MSRKLADFPKRRGRRGIALVAVLWGLTLLALVAANFTRTTRTEVRLAYSLLESAKAEALAEAGVHRTILSLAGFEDGFFDHVIMSMSLQAVHNTQGILAEMLRVGREAVVSFPNFAYWRHRQALLNGHMPVSTSLPHQWYNTPNRRFFTISDFEALCEMNGIVIREGLGFDEGVVIKEEPNFLASLALYRLGRDH